MRRVFFSAALFAAACGRIHYGPPSAPATSAIDVAFAAASLPAAATFTRASSATAVDTDGSVVLVGDDEPRFTTLGDGTRGLLIEPPRRNFVANNRFEVSDDDWQLAGIYPDCCNVTDGGLAGNGGHHMAVRRIETDSYEGEQQLVSGLMVGAHYVISVYVRGVGSGIIAARIQATGSPESDDYLLTTDVTRLVYDFTATQANTQLSIYSPYGNVGDGFDFSLVQLEPGSSATSVIVNDTDEPMARAAELLSAPIALSSVQLTVNGEVRDVVTRSRVAGVTDAAADSNVGSWLFVAPAPEAGRVTFSTSAGELADTPLAASFSEVLSSNATAERYTVGALPDDVDFDATYAIGSLHLETAQ